MHSKLQLPMFIIIALLGAPATASDLDAIALNGNLALRAIISDGHTSAVRDLHQSLSDSLDRKPHAAQAGNEQRPDHRGFRRVGCDSGSRGATAADSRGLAARC